MNVKNRPILFHLTVSHLLIAIFSLLMGDLYLLNALRTHTLNTVEDNLAHQGSFIADLMGKHMEKAMLTREERALITGEMKRLALQSSSRIQVVNWQGKVLEDTSSSSGKTRGEPVASLTVGDREEVQEALHGRRGSAVRGEPDGSPYGSGTRVFVAVPLRAKGKVFGAIYLSRSLSYLHSLFLALQKNLIVAFFFALSASALLGVLISRVMARPLMTLTAAVRDFAEGGGGESPEGSGESSTRHREQRTPARSWLSPREMNYLGAQFAEMKKKIRGQMTFLRNFMADISHELKTPIASLKAMTELLLDGALEDRVVARKFIGSIQDEASRLQRLAGDLLELSRLRSGAVMLEKENLLMGSLVERCIQRFQPRGIPVVSSVPSEISVQGDAHRLEQVINNLLDNATRSVSRRLKEEGIKGKIEVLSRTEPGWVTLEVRDNGVGIPQEHLTGIFERFYRLEREEGGRTHGSDPGSGLGLAIAKEIVAAHGGRIWAESREGASFFVKLPVKPMVADRSPA